MDGFNIGKILLGLQSSELFFKKIRKNDAGKVDSFAPQINSSIANTRPQQNQLLQNLQAMSNTTQILQMNALAGLDRAVFVKNLLGLLISFCFMYYNCIDYIILLCEMPKNAFVNCAKG